MSSSLVNGGVLMKMIDDCNEDKALAMILMFLLM